VGSTSVRRVPAIGTSGMFGDFTPDAHESCSVLLHHRSAAVFDRRALLNWIGVYTWVLRP